MLQESLTVHSQSALSSPLKTGLNSLLELPTGFTPPSTTATPIDGK